MSNPVYLALDVPQLEPAKALVEKVGALVSTVTDRLEPAFDSLPATSTCLAGSV